MTEASKTWVKWDYALWRSDPGLRTCSLAARGLWKEMLCIMHAATPYGHLVANMKPISDRHLLQMVGGSDLKEIRKLLRELRDAGVFSETSDGVIYSRKQVRDHEEMQKHRRNGRLGGNPTLKKTEDGVNPSDEPPRSTQGLTVGLKQNQNQNQNQNQIKKEEVQEEETPTPPPEPKTVRAKARTQIDPGWKPSEAGIAYAKARNVPPSELQAFRDHHIAHGKTMVDWDAAWRTWCNNSVKFRNNTLPFNRKADDDDRPRMVGGF